LYGYYPPAPESGGGSGLCNNGTGEKSIISFIKNSILLNSNRLIMNYDCPVNDLQISLPVVWVHKDKDFGWMDWYRGVPMALLPTTICPGMLNICHIIRSNKSLLHFFWRTSRGPDMMFTGKSYIHQMRKEYVVPLPDRQANILNKNIIQQYKNFVKASFLPVVYVIYR